MIRYPKYSNFQYINSSYKFFFYIIYYSKLEQIFFMEMKLKMELKDGQKFQGWHEGMIKFAPTYKYYPDSDVYYGCVEGKKGEKRRAPAW